MTRSNLDRGEDCGEAPQGTSLAQLRSNVLDFRRLKSHARRFRHGTHSEVQGNLGRAHARSLQARCVQPGARQHRPKRVENDMVVGHYTNKDGKLVVGRVRAREGEPNWGTVERRIERVNEAQKAAGKRATRKERLSWLTLS